MKLDEMQAAIEATGRTRPDLVCIALYRAMTRMPGAPGDPDIWDAIERMLAEEAKNAPPPVEHPLWMDIARAGIVDVSTAAPVKKRRRRRTAVKPIVEAAESNG